GHRRFAGRGRVANTNLIRGTTDDRRDDEPQGARGEDPGRRSVARDDRLRRRTADGDGGRRPDRRRLWREEPSSARTAQWLPGQGLGDARRQRRAAHPQAQEGLLLSELPGAAPY